MFKLNQLYTWSTIDLIKPFIFNGLIFFSNADRWIMEGSIVAYNKPHFPYMSPH